MRSDARSVSPLTGLSMVGYPRLQGLAPLGYAARTHMNGLLLATVPTIALPTGEAR